eukprot:TRINITY_DN2239_c0_g2_i5.p1 TRINITY_DN2239_c0_g2~~TRINITY_DN2239_c0_g2_i5.p1  ORF type:complete len:223 (-),score=-15.61 TRINITY_DN2239_c0_g2_i5:531-1199(-)
MNKYSNGMTNHLTRPQKATNLVYTSNILNQGLQLYMQLRFAILDKLLSCQIKTGFTEVNFNLTIAKFVPLDIYIARVKIQYNAQLGLGLQVNIMILIQKLSTFCQYQFQPFWFLEVMQFRVTIPCVQENTYQVFHLKFRHCKQHVLILPGIDVINTIQQFSVIYHVRKRKIQNGVNRRISYPRNFGAQMLVSENLKPPYRQFVIPVILASLFQNIQTFLISS